MEEVNKIHMAENTKASSSSTSQHAEQYYKTAHEVGLNPGDAGGPQAHFFERFLKANSDVKDETIQTVRQGYLFTSRLRASQKKKTGKSKRHVHNLLTARDRKTLGIFEIETGDVTYDTFLKVHDLWKGYFREAVGTERTQSAVEALQRSLMKADYTGCHFVVAASKCASLVGTTGLVVQETKNCFRIITKTDRILCIPKKGSLFAFTLDDKLFKIYGSHFRKHGFERGKTKFKVTENIDL
ncbi:ribonuclease P protein subunit p29-like isoform X3 [Varroa destructor]|uniref:Ribonuclease P protein subunit p29 n=1 Tax=Varroa destructor TaxID=109461 RepID=A0A7M7KVY6_VARDE|nr:ribonuclease P protein subunit p29-like isoform X3 [Varroa destructor]